MDGVHHRHIEGAAVGQPMGRRGRKDDRLDPAKELVEIGIAQDVPVLGLRLQLHQVHDVDYPDFQAGQLLSQDGNGRECLKRGHVATAAMTTSGEVYWSLLAHCQMPIPSAQCFTAASMVSHCGAGCLPATTTLT